MIKKYRKKPVVIEAMIYEGGLFGWHEAEKFVGTDILFPYMMSPASDSIHIKTLEGLMEVRNGDYIIKGVKGEFYPCKPDIFALTYDEVKPLQASPLTEEDLEALKELEDGDEQ